MNIETLLLLVAGSLILGYVFGIYIERNHGKDRAEKQILEVVKWQKETFPTANASSKIDHLKQEVDELQNDIEGGNFIGAQKEFADCFLLLFGAAYASGYNWNNIWDFIHWKMEINKKCKWGKPDANGVVNHIKENEH